MIIQILIKINFNMAHIMTLITSVMVFILIMQGNVSQPIPKRATSMMTEFECHADSDCHGENTYCDIGLNLCSQCLNCGIYFRTPKKNLMCPKDILDCSICLDGYSEEIFFGGEIRDICVPIDSNILPTPAKVRSGSYWQNIGLFFVIINMCLLSVLWTFFYKKVWKYSSDMSNDLQSRLENELPSYNSCMKLDNFVTDDVQEFHLFTGEQPPRNEWRHQNAVPFDYIQDTQEPNSNHAEENESIEETDEIDIREFEHPEIHDEETMPSAWVPSPPSFPEMRHLPNNYLRNATPPAKRMRFEEPTDEKSNEDEDASDLSQDEL